LKEATALTTGHPMLILGGGVAVLECMDLSQAMK